MIKKIIYLAFLLPLAGNAQTTVIKPLVKQPTAFAIITDNQTYANTKDAMHQYKTAVEDDGLATYLISGDWQNPDQVKQIIITDLLMHPMWYIIASITSQIPIMQLQSLKAT